MCRGLEVYVGGEAAPLAPSAVPWLADPPAAASIAAAAIASDNAPSALCCFLMVLGVDKATCLKWIERGQG